MRFQDFEVEILRLASSSDSRRMTIAEESLYRANRSRNFLAAPKCSYRFSSARNSGECEIRLHPDRRVG